MVAYLGDGNDDGNIIVVHHDYPDSDSEHSQSDTDYDHNNIMNVDSVGFDFGDGNAVMANTNDEIIEITNKIADVLVRLGYSSAAVPSRKLNDDTTEWIIDMEILTMGLEALQEFSEQVIDSNIDEGYISGYIANILDIRESYENNLSPGEWDANHHPSLYNVFLPHITEARDEMQTQIMRISHDYQNVFSPFMERLDGCITTMIGLIE